MIREGKALLPLQIDEKISRELEVFYNPKMELNRDVSLEVLSLWDRQQIQVALPLAGSGVRAIRFAKELSKNKIKQLACNDHDSDAVAKIHELLQVNDLQEDSRIEVHQEDAEKFLLNSKGFDYIDIDPFGSPNFLLDSAIKRISRGGILAVTATDTGALAGSFINAGKMKYWALNRPITQKHEFGLRILIRKVMLVAMQHAKALTPIVSYHHEHYYRVFFLVQKGKTAAAKAYDLCARQINYCDKCGNCELSTTHKCSYCGQENELLGPLYSGPLQQWKLTHPHMQKYNADIDQVGFFATHELAKLHQKELPKMDALIESLKQKGFAAAKSAFDATGICTTASLAEVLTHLRCK